MDTRDFLDNPSNPNFDSVSVSGHSLVRSTDCVRRLNDTHSVSYPNYSLHTRIMVLIGGHNE